MSKETILSFIYDAEYCQREEDDPLLAIYYFHPQWVSDQQKVTLVGQFMGMVHLISSVFNEPDMVNLETGKFAFKNFGQFVLAIGSDKNIPDWLTMRRMHLFISFVKLYHKDFDCVFKMPDFRQRLAVIFETYIPILQYAAPFHSNMHLLHVPYNSCTLFNRTLKLLHQIQNGKCGVLASMLLFQNKIVFSELYTNLSKMITITEPHRVPVSTDEPTNGCKIPKGAKLLDIYISRNEYEQLKNTHAFANKYKSFENFTRNYNREKKIADSTVEGEQYTFLTWNFSTKIIDYSLISSIAHKTPMLNDKAEKPFDLGRSLSMRDFTEAFKTMTKNLSEKYKSLKHKSTTELELKETTLKTNLNDLLTSNPLISTSEAILSCDDLAISTTFYSNRTVTIKNKKTRTPDVKMVAKPTKMHGSVSLKNFDELEACNRRLNELKSENERRKLKTSLSESHLSIDKINVNQSISDDNKQSKQIRNNSNQSCDETTDNGYNSVSSDTSSKIEQVQKINGIKSRKKSTENSKTQKLQLILSNSSDDNSIDSCQSVVSLDLKNDVKLTTNGVESNHKGKNPNKNIQNDLSCQMNGKIERQMNESVTTIVESERVEAENQTNDMVKLTLFTFAVKNTIIVHVVDNLLAFKPHELVKLYDDVLTKIDVELTQSTTNVKMNCGLVDGLSGFLNIHQQWDMTKRCGLWNVTDLSIVNDLHNDFMQFDGLDEIIIKNDNSVLYGCKLKDSFTFFAENSPIVAGLPVVGDALEAIADKAKCHLKRNYPNKQ